MIAYVFWHTRRQDADQFEYELNLKLFHDALRAHPTAGFISSLSFSLPGASWIPGDTGGYEDWYLLENSAALDPLNAGAVSGEMEEPHRTAARGAAWGVAGLYQPVTERGSSIEGPSAVWFDRPDGLSYPSMFKRLEAGDPDARDHLWQRMMTLGPTPEFCMLARGADSLAWGWRSELVVRRRIVWEPIR